MSTSARTHKEKKMTEKLVPQLPYNPVLTPADIFLLPKLDISFKGHQFQSADEIQEKNAREDNPNSFKTVYEMLMENEDVDGTIILMQVGTIP
jgi:hypothetical protein